MSRQTGARRHLDALGLMDGQNVTASVDELEQLAMTTYPWHTHAHDDESYWLTSTQAAEVLGLSIARGEAVPGRGPAAPPGARVAVRCPDCCDGARWRPSPTPGVKTAPAQALARPATIRRYRQHLS